MHESVAAYLATLVERRKSPHTLRAVRQDLTQFVSWWERQNSRSFDPVLLLDTDLRDWRRARQQHDGAAPATINRALSTLRGYCAWAAASRPRTAAAARQSARRWAAFISTSTTRLRGLTTRTIICRAALPALFDERPGNFPLT